MTTTTEVLPHAWGARVKLRDDGYGNAVTRQRCKTCGAERGSGIRSCIDLESLMWDIHNFDDLPRADFNRHITAMLDMYRVPRDGRAAIRRRAVETWSFNRGPIGL